MQETPSTCPYCGVGCGVIIQSDGDTITGVRGDPHHPANFGRLCTKGSTLHLTASRPVTLQTRLLQPQLRPQRGQAAHPIDWDAALDTAAQRFAATIDRHGYIQLRDRTKDVIKSGGEWISSVELENEIMAHPAVAEAAVIGLPHPKWGERPLACIVLREGASATKDDITAQLDNLVFDGFIAATPEPHFTRLDKYVHAIDVRLKGWTANPAREQQNLDVITELCDRLLKGGAPGIHFYSMNQSALTLELCRRLGLA